MEARRERVWVYGTLRSGASNHFRMKGAEFITVGTIRGRMYRFDWYPGLVLDEAGDDLTGEVYEVDSGLLEELDLFEGLSAGEIEGSEYRRVRVSVHDRGGHRSPISAWIWEWLGPVDETRRMKGGDWLNAPEV